MTTALTILYDKAEEFAAEWASQIKKQRNNGNINGLLVFSRARTAAIIERLEAIEKLEK